MTATAVSPDVLVAHFAGKLTFETDPSDVRADQQNSTMFVLVDSRGDQAWAQGRITGAIHLPTAQIAARARTEIPLDTPVVVYCWGPGCNGSTRAALEFARLGYQVREMIGGYEYWVREGYPAEDDQGALASAIDPLTAPRGAISCDC
ncbi:rhodanese-like domain-containing protein [Microbacterium sp. ZW T5_56]|uniref:rhodanese-like domain-containing protein n=1 Tax=Microbacterium sp. ZW T5_56 TaxID=3378081 RepID=UPI003855127A